MKFRLAAATIAALLAANAHAQEGPPPVNPAPPPVTPENQNLPPPLPPEPQIEFFYALNGVQHGPVGLDQLREMIARGEVVRTTLVWKRGMDNWDAAENVAELAPAFVNAPPKLPFDCTAQIVGMWESVTFTGGSQTVTQARYDASGQFSGVMTAMGLPGSTYYGTWKAVAVADNSCSITLNIAFPHGTSVTAIYDIVDRNLMTDKATGTQIRRIQ